MTTDESTASPSRPGVVPVMVRPSDPDTTSQPFWDAARDDRLVVQRCAVCGTFRSPPGPVCPNCQSFDAEWIELPGTGILYTFTIVRHPLHPRLADVCPYVAGVVELDGTQGPGARMLGNVVDVDPDEVAIGDPVRIVFDHVDDDVTVLRFAPARPVGRVGGEEDRP